MCPGFLLGPPSHRLILRSAAQAARRRQRADEAVKGATDFVRDGSRQQIASTIAVAAFIGLLIGRRSGRT